MSSHQRLSRQSLSEKVQGSADVGALNGWVINDVDGIKNAARGLWEQELQKNMGSATTYQGQHSSKILDEPSRSRVRPSSPTRKNKPHPLEVFLVNRLHNIPGYYNSPGKYDLHETEEKHECLKMHERPGKLGYLNADRNQEILQRLFTDPSSAQAAEAWMRLASSSDRRAVEDMIQTAVCAPKTRSKGPTENRTYVAEGVAQCVKTDYVAGVTDWINKATKEETVAVEKLFRTLSTNPNKPLHSSVTGSSAQQRGLKYCAMDFQIHPEWISKPWHIHYRRSHT